MSSIKILLIVCVCFFSAILAQAAAAQATNFCKVRFCASCRLKDGSKYCESCVRSYKINTFYYSGSEGTTDPSTYQSDLGECSTVGYPEESKKCYTAYKPDHATKSGCSSCEEGYTLSEGTPLLGKTEYTCTEPVGSAKIENCRRYSKSEQIVPTIYCPVCK